MRISDRSSDVCSSDLVALEHFTVVTDLFDDLDNPVFGQLQVFTVFTVSAEHTGDVRVLGGFGFSFNVLRSDAGFFSVEHGIASPAHDFSPLFVAITYDRTQ